MNLHEIKRFQKIAGILNEDISSIENHPTGVIFKPTTFNGQRPTMILKLDSNAYQKVADQFDDKGRPVGDKVKNIPFGDTNWNLFSQKIPYGDKSKIGYRIYGVSGDYTFGGAPPAYQNKLAGNKKAANAILSKFIKDFNLQ